MRDAGFYFSKDFGLLELMMEGFDYPVALQNGFYRLSSINIMYQLPDLICERYRNRGFDLYRVHVELEPKITGDN